MTEQIVHALMTFCKGWWAGFIIAAFIAAITGWPFWGAFCAWLGILAVFLFGPPLIQYLCARSREQQTDV